MKIPLTNNKKSEKMSSAEERKRKRLDAWRKKQQDAAAAAAPAKVSMSLGGGGLAALANKKKKKKRAFAVTKPKAKNKKASNPFFADDEGDSDPSDKEEDGEDGFGGKSKQKMLSLETITQSTAAVDPSASAEEGPPRKRSRGRWDKKAPAAAASETTIHSHDDALDKFMEKLEAGALGNVTTQRADEDGAEGLKINVSGSMMPRKSALLLQQKQQNPLSGGVITPEELQRLTAGVSSTVKTTVSTGGSMEQDAMDVDEGPRYTNSDWESEDGKSEVSNSYIAISSSNVDPDVPKTITVVFPCLLSPKHSLL